MKSTIKAIIVEDMAEYIDTIQFLLKEVAPDVVVAGKASTLTEAEKLMTELEPDLVFLDIQFENEGKTGFDLLDSLKKNLRLNFQLIIITAHIEKQYYAKAFEYKALHFLEKPISKEKLSDAIERVKQSLLEIKLNALETFIHKELEGIRLPNKTQRVNIEGHLYNEMVEVDDILWIEADGRKSTIWLKNGRSIESVSNLGFFENELSAFHEFLRINRSEIININHVERYSKKEKMAVLFGNKINHIISKDIFATFVDRINSIKRI